MFFRRLLIAAVSLNLSLAPAMADSASIAFSRDVPAAGGGSEYVSGNYPGAILISVNLWGAVVKPGIHHIPTHTDLLTLLSLAGGPLPDAEAGHITIKRMTGGKEKVIEVDANHVLDTADVRSPILEANDIVVVPREKNLVSNNTMTVLSFTGGILGVILAAVALSNQVKK